VLLRLISVGVIMVGILSVLPSHASAQGATVTGCLSRTGRIVKAALGEQPARPCSPRETQVSWPLEGDDTGGALERADFFITMERDGPDETIATNGPFEIFARCHTNVLGDLNFFIRLVAEVDGWWGSSGAGHGPYVAGEELQMFAHSISSTSEERGFYNGSNVGSEASSAVAPDGSFIAIDPETLSLGMKILDHDCIAVGSVILHKGAL
jgi:hypothetical protein